jgi:hypothetical protein
VRQGSLQLSRRSSRRFGKTHFAGHAQSIRLVARRFEKDQIATAFSPAGARLLLAQAVPSGVIPLMRQQIPHKSHFAHKRLSNALLHCTLHL